MPMLGTVGPQANSRRAHISSRTLCAENCMVVFGDALISFWYALFVHSATHFECIEKGETDRGIIIMMTTTTKKLRVLYECTIAMKIGVHEMSRCTSNDVHWVKRVVYEWMVPLPTCLHVNFVIRKLLLITLLEFKLYAFGWVFSSTRTLLNYYMLAPLQFWWIRRSFLLFVRILQIQPFRSIW